MKAEEFLAEACRALLAQYAVDGKINEKFVNQLINHAAYWKKAHRL